MSANKINASTPDVPGSEVTQTLDVIIAEADANTDGLSRTIGPINLTSIGVAAVVGAGIFVVTGHAAATKAGPAVIISFIIAGIAAALSAICYAELAAMIPLSGSTYSYAYAGLGTFVAWIIGWDLIVEYLFGAANVANGWSGYFVNLLSNIGINIPEAWTAAPVGGEVPGAIMNLPAMVLVGLLTWLLLTGSRQSSTATTIFVGIKLITLAVFVVAGLTAINFSNFVPFVPANTGTFGEFGWSGVLVAAGTVFYSFISFDAVCTAAQEAKNPRRTVPIGVLGSLIIATILYVVIGFVLIGLVSYQLLDVSDPLSVAVEAAGMKWVSTVIDIGATIGLGASVLALLFAQTRILMRMSEDAMLPPLFRYVSPKHHTPTWTTISCGVAAIVMAGMLPLSILTELISIGTLLAFVIVSAAVIVLRKTRPDLPRPFKVPGGPTVPILAIVVSLAIMLTLPWETWLRLAVWLVLGLVVYFAYSRKRSKALVENRIAEHLARAQNTQVNS